MPQAVVVRLHPSAHVRGNQHCQRKEVHYDEPDPGSALRWRGPCATTLKLHMLGPLEVLEDGCKLPLGGKMVRALLVALLLHAREVRTTDQLIDDLWGDRAPATHL